MKISFGLKKAAAVFGIGFVIFWLLRPANSTKPLSSKESNPEQQKKNAVIVMTAYMNALKAGETATNLEELNKLTQKEYGLRVYKKSDGKYAVKDDNGNDIKT